MARKPGGVFNTTATNPLEDAVSAEIYKREEAAFNTPIIHQPRVRVSPRDYYRLKVQATIRGMDMAELLGELIREYLKGVE